MRFVFIIFSLLTAAVAQQPFLTCTYYFFGETYGCDLTINNPNCFNNFTEIGGTHFKGFTNADVKLLYGVDGVSKNIPRIICDTFRNIASIELYNIGLTEIDDSAFARCPGINDLILFANKISSITTQAFVNLPNIRYINLERNLLSTLPENLFINQKNLTILGMNSNPFEDLPIGLFRPLENLQVIYLGYSNLTTINNRWFSTNARLYYLHLEGNMIHVSDDSFIGLDGLRILNLAYNAIYEIPTRALTGLRNLQTLFLNGNNFTAVQPDSFSGLGNLVDLDLSETPIQVIHDGAFRGLINLSSLYMPSCRLRQLYSNSFDDLRSLSSIYLHFNEIDELPQSVFANSPNLNYIGLWNNRLKTLRRHSFGTLKNLIILDLDGNILNALDREIIDDAVVLNILSFNGNLCANNRFGNFLVSRAQYLPMLERCFSNMKNIVDTITEGDEYSFFEGPHPGIVFRVNAGNEVNIALTPFDFIWSPSIEIFIGTTNNTRSVIRINEKTNVVTVPTPNIITRDQWNDFRVTWANQIILVYRGNDSFPFMSFTMKAFFPVNFYGLKAIETRASWSVQPFDW